MMTPQIIQNIDMWKQSDFKSQYFRRFLENTDYVLCSVSAAEYLGLCNWTADPKTYVLTKAYCMEKHIAIDSKNGLYFTTVNQTINDLLADTEMDEQVILESLADQYYKNAYADLHILEENQAAFEYFRPMAEAYYTYE